MFSSSVLWRLVCCGAFLACIAASSGIALFCILPPGNAPATGLRVDGLAVPDGTPLRQFVSERIALRDATLVDLPQPGPSGSVSIPLQQLGIRGDIEATVTRALAVARSGSLEQRLHESLLARTGGVDVPLVWHVDFETVTKRLLPLKEQADTSAIPARLDLVNHRVIPHQSGQYLDIYRAIDLITEAAQTAIPHAKLMWTDIPPVASSELLERLDVTQTVGHFETRFGYLGAEASRAQNIATAASHIDGFVLMPDQVLSFNEVVGHRTVENGFRKGWEIFRGEMVEGIGGGTCQVASTLHAAAYLAGLDIVERAPHSRPSGYITMGLDSTVVDGSVDLKIRNPFPFPIVVHSIVDRGKLTVELLGSHRPASVTFKRDVVSLRDFKRQVRETSYLEPGKVVLKQHGIRGYSIRRTRGIRFRDGSEREEVTTDTYPATAEIYLVPPGTDESVLPPLPNSPVQAGAQDVSAPTAASSVQIVVAPGVHHPSPEQVNASGRVVITR